MPLEDFERSRFNMGESRQPPLPVGTPEPGTDPTPATVDHSHGFAPEWKALPLASGWTNFGSYHNAAQYALIDKLVIVRGLVVNAAATGTSVIVNLPESIRMTRSNSTTLRRCPSNSGNGTSRVDICGPNDVNPNTIKTLGLVAGDAGFLEISFEYYIN